ncbi:MAG: hypothetical protein HY899_14575 [Deltaproteobacteria bacterium]|nr:hypothetical protein [Deltaproteobacteria bacterium]
MNVTTVHRILDVAEATALVRALPTVLEGAGPRLAYETAWVKPGRYFNVAYRIENEQQPSRSGEADPPSIVSLCIVDRAMADKATRRQRTHQRSAGRGGCAHCATVLAAPDVLVQLFPYDYRLPRLADCASVETVAGVSGGRHAFDRCEVMAYRPGMRCQLRYDVAGLARAYGKISVERESGRRARVHGELHAALEKRAGLLRVPAPLGSIHDLGLDLVAAASGENLYDRMAGNSDEGLVLRAIDGLAELHQYAPAPADRIHDADDELALVDDWVSWMAGVEPPMADRLWRAHTLLAQSMPTASNARAGFAHRDFYDKQLLADGEILWLLDVDTACSGDRELDAGNFLAHLFLRGVQWNRSAVHRRLEDEAWRAYRSRAGAAGADVSSDLARWYRRAALVRLACTYALRPPWRHLAPALLEEAVTP